MGRTFQITEIFPELTVRENVRIAVETGLGLQPARLAQPAPIARSVEDASDEVLTHGQSHRPPIGWWENCRTAISVRPRSPWRLR
jgi:hypothetical protein